MAKRRRKAISRDPVAKALESPNLQQKVIPNKKAIKKMRREREEMREWLLEHNYAGGTHD